MKRNHIGAMLLGLLIGVSSGVAFGAGGAEDLPADTLPMEEYVGFGHDPSLEQRIFVDEEIQRQQVIERCMRDRGFRYDHSILTTMS